MDSQQILPGEQGGSDLSTYAGSYEEVQEVGMGQHASATSRDETPVLATYGLATCIGTVLYDEEQELGFVSHSVMNDADDGKDPHIQAFYDSLAESLESYTFTVTYALGNVPDGRVLDSVRYTVQEGPEHVSVAAEQTERVGRNGSVALDTRTGDISLYDRTQHPDFVDLLRIFTDM